MFAITLKFLEALQRNNTKQWLHAHRDLYQQEKKRFTACIAAFLQQTKKLNPLLEDLEAEQCLYRINREPRFAREGKPYKEFFGAMIIPAGKKSDHPCFHLRLEPGKSYLMAGAYMPNAQHEQQLRTKLMKEFHRWQELISSSQHQKYYGQPHALHQYKSTYKRKQLVHQDPELLEQISPTLQAYDLRKYAQSSALTPFPPEAKEQLAQLMYFKEWLFFRPLSDELLTSEHVLQEMYDSYQAILPMLNFLQEAYEESIPSFL